MNPAKNTHFVFANTSFDQRFKIGVGCKLVLEAKACQDFKDKEFKTLPFELKEYDNINATRLELETVIWAIETLAVKPGSSQLFLCTTSKTVQGLLEKRAKLQKTDYMSVRPGIPVTNADLFKEFFKLHDRFNFEFVNIETTTNESTLIQNILLETFNQADRVLKNRLKAENKVADKWF